MKLKKNFYIVILFVLFLTGCSTDSSQPSSLKILRLSSTIDPPTLDPRKISDTVSAGFTRLYLDGLTRWDKDGNIQLALAESVEILDEGKRYIFKLKDAYWTDGTPITADQFVETWKNNLRPDFPSPLVYSMYPIINAQQAKDGKVHVDEIGISALDEKTLEVRLRYPDPYFLQVLAVGCFFPYPETIASKNLSLIKNDSYPLIGCGPFSLTHWKKQDVILFKKNKTYHATDAIHLDEIRFFILSDASTTLSLYEDNQLDWIGSPFSSIPDDALEILKERDDFHIKETTGIYFYVFNTLKYPFNNANIRKALTLAINRDDIVSYVLQTGNPIALNVVPPILDPQSKTYYKDHNDIKANQYFLKGLKELNINRKEFPIPHLYFNLDAPGHAKIAQAIQQQWKKALSLDVELVSKEWKVYLDEFNNRQFEIARLGMTSLYADPYFLLEDFAYENSPMNRSGWFDQTFANLVEKAKNTSDLKERNALLQKAENILMDAMPIAPIYFYNVSYLKKNHVKDLAVDVLGSAHFVYADLEPHPKGS